MIVQTAILKLLLLVFCNGTDSKLGIGFRLGQHADFQVLIELGPQTETDPIGTNDAKRRRDAAFSAAMKGELGSLAQTIAKYQLERSIQKMDKLKTLDEKLKTIKMENTKDQKDNAKDQETVSSEWLTKWRKEIWLKDDTTLNSTKNGDNKVVQ